MRFIGFTGHKDPSHTLKMLATPFAWNTVQMPINVLDAHLAKTAEPGRDGKLEPPKTTRYGAAYHFRQHGE